MSDIAIVLLTPFQLRQLEITKKQFSWDVHKAVFYSLPLVSKEEIMKVLQVGTIQHQYIPDEKISLPNMMRKPFSEVRRHRAIVRNLAGLVRESLDVHAKITTLIIGSDKDIFSQLLMESAKAQNPQLLIRAIDEGSGYYKEASNRDKMYKVVYSLFSKLIFGHRFKYIGTLGQHPSIGEVYARFVKEIPNKKPWISYYEIKPVATKTNIGKPKKDLLLLTSPLSEDHHCDAQKEQEVLHFIFNQLGGLPIHVDIKPHPREGKGKYESYITQRIQVLDGARTAEDINYFDYHRVMNFGSSIVLDIFQEGFPMKNVVTLDTQYASNKLADRLYHQGDYMALFDSDFQTQYTQWLHEAFV